MLARVRVDPRAEVALRGLRQPRPPAAELMLAHVRVDLRAEVALRACASLARLRRS